MPIWDVSEIHVDTALTNISKALKLPDLVAEEIAPVVNVRKESDTYWEFGREELRELDDGEGDIRADKSTARTFDWKPTAALPYRAEERALKTCVSDRAMANADQPIRPRMRSVEKLTYQLRLQYEIRITALVTDTALIGSTAAPLLWTDPAAEIEADVKAAKEEVRTTLGVDPNTIILGVSAANAVVDFLKASSEISIRERSSIFEIPDRWLGMKVLVSKAVKNTAAEGAADVLTDVWPEDTVLVAWINPGTPALEDASLAWTIRARAFEVRAWRDEARRGTWHEVSWIQDERLVATESAHLITGVL